MEKKHTQGEWKILGDLYTVSDDEGLPVAITALGMRDADECLANARLIAAAPDLLAALQNMVGAFHSPIARRKLPSDFNVEAIESAQAAIAKATGAA